MHRLGHKITEVAIENVRNVAPKKFNKKEREAIEMRKLFGENSFSEREKQLVQRAYSAGQIRAHAHCSKEGGDGAGTLAEDVKPANVWTDDIDPGIFKATGLKLTFSTVLDEVRAISVARVEANRTAIERQLQRLPPNVMQMRREDLMAVESDILMREDPPTACAGSSQIAERAEFSKCNDPIIALGFGKTVGAEFPIVSTDLLCGNSCRVLEFKTLTPLLSPSKVTVV